MSWFQKGEKREDIPQERRDDLFNKVKEVLINDFDIPAEQINLQGRFREDFKFDSVDTVQANILLEEVFGIEILDEDIVNILTVNDLIYYLYFRLKEEPK